MKGLKELDRVLRGEANSPADGNHGPSVSVLPLLITNLLLAAFYGICMGIFGLSGREVPEYRQMIADAFKVPLLFLLTLLVTFPSLYVFSALVGSRLGARDLIRLLTASLGVLIAVLAAFGPIVGFFSITTSSYPFIVLMNVAVYTLAAVLGLSYLIRTFGKMLTRRRVKLASTPSTENQTSEPEQLQIDQAEVNGAQLPQWYSAAHRVLYVWLGVFALVGAQMSWVLRPFIGSPTMEFTWFRPREASFFEGVFNSIRMLLGV